MRREAKSANLLCQHRPRPAGRAIRAADILGTAAVGGAWDESEGATAQALGLGAGGRARSSAAAPNGPGGTGVCAPEPVLHLGVTDGHSAPGDSPGKEPHPCSWFGSQCGSPCRIPAARRTGGTSTAAAPLSPPVSPGIPARWGALGLIQPLLPSPPPPPPGIPHHPEPLLHRRAHRCSPRWKPS